MVCGIAGLPLGLAECDRAGSTRMFPRVVGQPQQAPGDNTVGSEGSFQAISGFQLYLLKVTAAFKDVMIPFDQPTQRVPADILDRFGVLTERQGREQQPADRHGSVWRVHFFGEEGLDCYRLELGPRWTMAWRLEVDRGPPEGEVGLPGRALITPAQSNDQRAPTV